MTTRFTDSSAAPPFGPKTSAQARMASALSRPPDPSSHGPKTTGACDSRTALVADFISVNPSNTNRKLNSWARLNAHPISSARCTSNRTGN